MLRALIAVPLLLVFVACASDDTLPTDGVEMPPPALDDGSITYWGHVEPILADNCVPCHNDTGIAPFPLTTYEEVQGAAGPVVLATRTREMPPWGVDNTGDCNTYTDARWLTDDEIDVIGDWVAQGTLEGTPPGMITPRIVDDRLESPTATLDMGAEYTPDLRYRDDYRCFVMDTDIETDQYLTAFEVEPGEPRVVHHIILFTLETDAAEERVLEMDEEDEGLGYMCFGGAMAGQDVRFLAGWAPGVPVTRYPTGTGIRVPAGRKVVMQVHYNLAAGALPDRTRIHLQLQPGVAQEAFVFPIADFGMVLPPREEYVETTFESGTDFLPIDNIKIHGVYPHMHTLGQTMRVELDRMAGDTECITDVPEWDFNWQQFYFFDDEMQLDRGDRMRITCGYDTLERSEPTTWGEGTEDEMCLNGFYVTLF